MPTIGRLKTLLPLPALLIAGLLLAGCGGGTVSPTSATAAAAATPAAAPALSPVELTGTPPTSVTAGQSYLFQPKVSQGGGVVTFSIKGQPTWATFDADTGVLTGTPATANEGTTGSITITGSNGSSSSSIGPFTIAVNAPSAPPPTTGSATLTWAAPTENTNGTPVTGLAGYHIYYGTTENAWSTTITVASPTQTSYVVTGLAPGTYYFAVVAYNVEGMDSPQSNVLSKTI
jgi:putative Ig domain-containing protein